MKRQWLLCGMLLSGIAPVWAATPSGLVREGNEAFQGENYDEALKLYKQAEKQRPDSAEIAFNQGAAMYRKGNYPAAAQRFTEAAQRAKDARLSALAEYNLGNTRFQQAEQEREGDLKESVKKVRESVGHYREAVRLDPSHRQSAENLEMARVYLKTLLEEQQQQQAQNGQQEQGEENGEDQQQQAPGQQGQPGEEDPDKQGQQGESQGAQGSSGEEEGKEEGKQAQAGQEKEEKDRKDAAGGESEKEEAEQKDVAQAQEGKEGAGEEEAAEEQAARAILEEEKENQERRRMRPLGRGIKPVEKDW